MFLHWMPFVPEQDDELSHTYGPLDGSLYATVGRKQQLQMQQEQHRRQLLLQQQQDHHLQLQQRRLQQLQVSTGGGGGTSAGPSPSSEHTISMDSGISSAGNGLPSGSAASGPVTSGPGPGQGAASSSSQRALDDLLNDMLLTVESIPDLHRARALSALSSGADLQRSQRPSGEARHYQRSQSQGAASGPPAAAAAPPRRQSSLSLAPLPLSSAPLPASTTAPSGARQGKDTPAATTSPTTDLDDIPYHARLDGRPFTYVPGAPGTSAPAPTKSSSATSNGYQSGLSSPGLVRKAHTTSNGYATSTPRPGHAHHNGTPNGSAWTPSPREQQRDAGHRYQEQEPLDG